MRPRYRHGAKNSIAPASASMQVRRRRLSSCTYLRATKKFAGAGARTRRALSLCLNAFGPRDAAEPCRRTVSCFRPAAGGARATAEPGRRSVLQRTRARRNPDTSRNTASAQQHSKRSNTANAQQRSKRAATQQRNKRRATQQRNKRSKRTATQQHSKHSKRQPPSRFF